MSERELVTISRIQKITPIEGKDRIELATVENYNVIVSKGEFKVGDLCVYVFYDVVLPQKPEFEFLRSRCWSKLYNGFRIKEMKMAGVFSSGIVFPLSILPENMDHREMVEGLDVTEVIGAVKYDPETLKERKALAHKKDNSGPVLKWFLKFKWFRKIFFKHKKAPVGYPDTVSKSGEINIQKNFNMLKSSGHRFIATEKLEGQSFMACLVPKKKKSEYKFYSHNAIRYKGDGSNWDLISTKYNMEEKLRRLYEKYKTRYAVEGEIVGPGIQGNIYGFSELKIFVFRIFNVDTGGILSPIEMWQICAELDLEGVPIISGDFPLPDTVVELVKMGDGMSELAPVKREGIVLTSTTDPTLRAKIKGEEYKVWFGKKYDKTV